MTDLLHPSAANDDDPTIDGADLLAEIRARLGFEAPVTAAESDEVPVEDQTIDGFDLLAAFELDRWGFPEEGAGQVRPESSSSPSLPASPTPPPTDTRWRPPVAAPAAAGPRSVRPGRVQLIVLGLALLTGSTLAWRVLEATATP